ncbi:rho-related GTP-binding protein RhoV [Danio rerio]|uniref:Ras homolog gene family, member V n=1 Tax=Danio rerio TaxID=7955 RepID=Q5YLG6_DANRE|nr:rho-related GTP-binding protein RhoV [Danio rerio]AAH98604.1 Ras homolog gene family, member V [Danio rerio]AAI54350.1 Ras homolog gene family, member V [Danio rerio]AAI71441.1 Ras homolog gene family, member V [Danio rerio]AAI71443.1 Ras homolog gene family, member V [Danio rerio]AAQ83831.1 ras family GTPase [Danio rerio]|eukprot:NP_001012250.1 rho-related GTP-binding protein RhoV [Danio rerio]
MPPQMDYFYHESRVPSVCLEQDEELLEPAISCMLVGDGAVGKTSMIVSYTTNGYPTDYKQTAFDVFSGQVQVDGTPVRIQLMDTAGQEEFDEFRSLSYAHTDVFLLCFSVVNPTSFQNITKKWIPEIRECNPSSPIILVGTQSDLVLDVNVLIDLDRYKVKPVCSSRARSLSEKIRAAEYVECSALTQKNLKEAFDAAIFAAIKHKARKAKKRRLSDRRTKAFSKCSWKKFFCFI